MGTSAYLNISLSQIQVFLTVAEYKNFTFAAQRLSLTQSDPVCSEQDHCYLGICIERKAF